MEFREATTDDATVMTSIQQEALRERAAGEYSTRQLEYMTDEKSDSPLVPPEWVEMDDRQYVIVERDGNPIGYGGIDTAEGILLATFVEPSASGHGIGSAIVERLHEITREHGHGELRTYASLNAVEFYERLGYTVDERTKVGEEEGPAIPSALMSTSL